MIDQVLALLGRKPALLYFLKTVLFCQNKHQWLRNLNFWRVSWTHFNSSRERRLCWKKIQHLILLLNLFCVLAINSCYYLFNWQKGGNFKKNFLVCTLSIILWTAHRCCCDHTYKISVSSEMFLLGINV